MRIAHPSNSNQNKINPLSWHFKITSLVISALLVIAASINPFPLTSSIKGCTKRERKSFSLAKASDISEVSVISFKVAKQAAAITGCPPKVVICPSFGLWLNRSIMAVEAVKAPTGIPPPMPFPITTISGITS
ncbi:hypothetical protein DCBHLPFO_00701 [Mycoplasmopsis arginini]|uniref:Uncharacterized protein n=1 Tax=Mycoplasmopsis arginini TaxID=2094 RepID=A0AA43R0X1_MYCAR|nr:hypothetical protein [Mycoplasmopsis arginini]